MEKKNKEEIISKVERWAKDIKLRSMKVSLHKSESFKPEVREREGLTEDDKLVIKQIYAEPNEREKIEKVIELTYQQAQKEIITKFKAHNRDIKTEEDIFDFIKRIEKCSHCDKIFWDKVCLSCSDKLIELIDFHVREAQQEFEKMIDSIDFSQVIVKTGWKDEEVNKDIREYIKSKLHSHKEEPKPEDDLIKGINDKGSSCSSGTHNQNGNT